MRSNEFRCYGCEQVFPKTQAIPLGGQNFCTECDQSWFICTSCGELLYESDVYLYDDDAYCESCFDNAKGKDAETFVTSWFDLSNRKIVRQEKIAKSLLKKVV